MDKSMPRFATAPTPSVTVRTVRILYILDTPLTLKSGWYPLRRPEEPAQRPRQTTKTIQMNTFCTYETNEKHPSSFFPVHFFFFLVVITQRLPALAGSTGAVLPDYWLSGRHDTRLSVRWFRYNEVRLLCTLMDLLAYVYIIWVLTGSIASIAM